jgi:hypothetical protein
MGTPNYDINYNDKRFTEVESDKKAALSELEQTYAGMINNSDAYYNAQINANKQWEAEQKKNQQAQTDFAIEKIEQQKAQAQKDYIKEQSGAYVDWQKQSNPYGANAEQMAAGGLQNTGYSESSQVSMYNTYQMRVVTAREAFERAKLDYDNQMNEARLKNSAILAEIAYNALQQRLELSLQGFQYKNQLILDKTSKKTELQNEYYKRYQDVLDQINKENALKEEVRQYNESLAEQKRQHNASIAAQNAQLALEREKFAFQKQQYADSKAKAAAGTIKKSSGGSGSSSKKSSGAKSSGRDSSNIREKKSTSTTKSAQEYLTALIKSGANKDKVANEIALALREGAITKKQAQDLRNIYTPRGIQY